MQSCDDLVFAPIFVLLAVLIGAGATFSSCISAWRSLRRIERRARSGLDRNEFYLEYQPIVDLRTGQWVGAEALLRWLHPRLGLIEPSTFIGELERTRAIAPLTEFVLSTALVELGSCRFPDGFKIHVNLASRHVEMPCFPDDLATALKQAPAGYQLVLELTERGVLDNFPAYKDRLISLRKQGVKYAIDDFGVGISNLALLRHFDFDYIKLDKQFVAELPNRGRGLIEGVSDFARRIHADVIAEGIEDPAQRDAVKDIGICYAQGYLFQRPKKIREFDRAYRQLQFRHEFS
ncbi:EAL domain-containing protein [Paraburkholderia azotifigens]|uniref:EAL domain-containing protein n=1 Tax=Paraburkholderia azotifigens TaxID=2057004 RepID=A0ABU9RGT3_9BURK